MKKKIAVEQLRVGMFLEGMDGSWLKHPFLRSSFVVKSPDDIRLIAESGIRHVWIDTGRGDDVAPAPALVPLEVASVVPAVPPPAMPKPASMADELLRASRRRAEQTGFAV